jgi:hypothetical protein
MLAAGFGDRLGEFEKTAGEFTSGDITRVNVFQEAIVITYECE